MANQQATLVELGWLAGIIDGEGWLGVSVNPERFAREGMNTRPSTVKVEIKITNCDPEIVYRAATILQMLDVNPYIRAQNVELKPNHKLPFEVAIKSMISVQRVLVALRDYLTGTKQERADIILRFIALRQGNLGMENPAYTAGQGRRGPRTIRPYTEEELALVTQCRALQSRKGASETLRATGEATLLQMKERIAALREQRDARRYSPAAGETQEIFPI